MLLQHSAAGGAGGENSGLGVSGQLQVGSRTLEAHLSDGIAESIVSLFKNLSNNGILIVECLAHTNSLGTLSREYESDLAHGKNLSFSNYTR